MFKKSSKVFIFLNWGPESLINAHPFFHLAMRLLSSTSVSLITKLHGKKHFALSVLNFSSLYLLVLILGNRREVPINLPCTFLCFQTILIFRYIFSSYTSLICIYVKQILFLLFFCNKYIQFLGFWSLVSWFYSNILETEEKERKRREFSFSIAPSRTLSFSIDDVGNPTDILWDFFCVIVCEQKFVLICVKWCPNRK